MIRIATLLHPLSLNQKDSSLCYKYLDGSTYGSNKSMIQQSSFPTAMKRCCLEAPIPQPTKNHVTARWIQPDRKAGMKMLNKLKPIIPKRILRSRWRWRFMERLNPKQSGDEFQVLKEGAGCWQVGKYVHCLGCCHFKIQNVKIHYTFDCFLNGRCSHISREVHNIHTNT